MSNENFGITQQGFKKRSFNNLIEKFKELIKEQPAFAEDIDLSENDPFFQINIPFLFLISELWEVAEQCVYTQSPKYAEGNILEAKGKIIGISKKRGNKATGIITVMGDEGKEIKKGFSISTKEGICFHTTETKIIPKGGKVDINIEADDIGENGNVADGTITEILTPVLGIKSITNKEKTRNGEYPESDVEFRERYDMSVAQRATNVFDSLRANILKISGVRDVLINVNNSMKTLEGVPPKSFHVIVLGGEDDEIAKAIFEKYPGGIEAYGTIKKWVKDSRNAKHLIGFSRPEPKEVWVKLKITKNKTFPNNGDKTLKETIKKYFDKFKIGQNVILYKIIASIDKADIDGIEDIEIEVSTDGKVYNSNNIILKDLEAVKTTLKNIEVIE